MKGPQVKGMEMNQEANPPDMGLTTEDVARLQNALVELGFDPGVPDGMMGPETISAIRAFQKENLLETTGIPDPQTFDLIMSGPQKKAAGKTKMPLKAKKQAGGIKTAQPAIPENLTWLSLLSADTPAANLPDALDFESDVNALASIIAYKEIDPPLAIGLFGNWGMGKSFFMNKLQQRIKKLHKLDPGSYYDDILSINFNSWHYSDSNLWASLITKIFEELEKYGETNEGKGSIENLLQNLNSAKELKEEKEKEKARLEGEINVYAATRAKREEDIAQATANLDKVRARDIIRTVWDDPAVRAGVKNLQDQYKFLEIKEVSQINRDLDSLENGFTKFLKSLKLVYSFRQGKLWMALLTALLIFGGFYFLSQFAGRAEEIFDGLKVYIGLAAALTSQAVVFLKPAFKVLNKACAGLTSLKKTCEELEEKKKQEAMKELDGISQSINISTAQLAEVKGKIEQLETEKKLIEEELKDITSGRKIMRFIENRVSDQRYVNSLGIISWVRKDFEELDFLLKQQYDAKRREELKREAVEDVYEIDRIVLYIDDLDRCDVPTVVKVLEAIHLLLAFPLFVVVVGVDPRWMYNALSIKYDKFLKNEERESSVEEAALERKNEEEGIIDHPATSYDYLEKIFQIPFVLKPIDETGKNKLIRMQFEKKPFMEKAGSNTVAPASNFERPAGMSIQQVAVANDADRSDAEPEEKEVLNLRPLEVSEEEIAFMQHIGFLIGDSPRTIKRYINIYRLLRSHSRFILPDETRTEHYMAAMALLAVVTGLPGTSKQFFDKIKQGKDAESFYSFLEQFLTQEVNKPKALIQLVASIGKGQLLYPFGKIRLDIFKANLGLISRFSFRNLA